MFGVLVFHKTSRNSSHYIKLFWVSDYVISKYPLYTSFLCLQQIFYLIQFTDVPVSVTHPLPSMH